MAYWAKISERKAISPKGVKVYINENLFEKNQVNHFNVTGTTTNTGIIYYDLPQFSKKFATPVFSIRNTIDKIQGRQRPQYLLSIGGKHFVSPLTLTLQKKSLPHLKNLDYSHFLNRYTWSIAGTVRFHNYASADRCVTVMNRLYKRLQRSHDDTFNHFFFVTEENPGKDGYHSHFVYGNNALPDADKVIGMVTEHKKNYTGFYDRASLTEPFNQKNYFLEYMVKQLHKMPEYYDFNHNIFR